MPRREVAMNRARRIMLSILAPALVLLGLVGVGPVTLPSVRPAAAVSWPTSTGILVSEVMVGGASASDEFVEVINAGGAIVDLQGLEVVYLSAAGTTPTRKTSWAASLLLPPGRHLLIANGSGTYASSADATYSGGLAATGGSIALRQIGGAPPRAVGL